jgi:hypothetical protein
MAVTSVKGVRCSAEDLERNRLLRLHRGEGESESEILLVAMRLGLRVLAAQAVAPGTGQYAGYDPSELAHRLRLDILPVLDFLEAQGQLPAIFQREVVMVPGGMVSAPAPPPAPPPATISADATGAVMAFSGGFLDDD